jgi:hypothetical protein
MILGICWMKEHKALFDSISHTMCLDSPAHGVVVP